MSATWMFELFFFYFDHSLYPLDKSSRNDHCQVFLICSYSRYVFVWFRRAKIFKIRDVFFDLVIFFLFIFYHFSSKFWNKLSYSKISISKMFLSFRVRTPWYSIFRLNIENVWILDMNELFICECITDASA